MALRLSLCPTGFTSSTDFQRLVDGRTFIFYDVRNRGYSDSVADASKLARGIHNDVDDLESVRLHFRIPRVDLIGHSYIGLMVVLHAMKYPDTVNRVVQIGPSPPGPKEHPKYTDSVLPEVFSKLGELQKQRASLDPVEFCRKFWAILGAIYVVDPADADKIDWGRCDLANERSFMRYWQENIDPSLKNLNLAAEDFAKVQAQVLTIHGLKDRSAPYDGGREWAQLLPNARLLTIENAGHAPWIESPNQVFNAIEKFLSANNA